MVIYSYRKGQRKRCKGEKMRTREAAIYYDYLAEIMEELSDNIDRIREDMYETQQTQGFTDTYLTNKLTAYAALYSQLDDLCYEG